MLIIYRNASDIDVNELFRIYCDSSQHDERANDMAVYDMLDYIRTMLQTDHESMCAAWLVQERLVAFLRLEGYCDGVLITALKTVSCEQGKGYATSLVKAILALLAGRKVYAHIHNNNYASIAVHQKCGFRRILDHAKYLDGSVSADSGTYLADLS